jgi:uncharacterized membrane protein
MTPARSAGRRAAEARGLDRLINFSDAVVAVAITLMALPLIDIVGPRGGQTILTVIGENALQLTTFLFTFYVVAVLWLAHNRILNVIGRYDGAVFWLNLTWLAAIVLLPWISSMSGDADSTAGGATLLYWVTLAMISALGTLLGRHIRRHPELWQQDDEPVYSDSRRSALRGPLFSLYFLAIGLVSLVWPEVSRWMPFGIIPLSIWLRPAREDSPQTTATEVATQSKEIA